MSSEAHGEMTLVAGSARLGCTSGLAELKAHKYFAGFDWSKLDCGEMDAEIKPNPNDINAPSKKDIEGFKPTKEVAWDPEDQDKFKDWNFFDKQIWYRYEAWFRIEKKKEIKADGAGGGGCCTIA